MEQPPAAGFVTHDRRAAHPARRAFPAVREEAGAPRHARRGAPPHAARSLVTPAVGSFAATTSHDRAREPRALRRRRGPRPRARAQSGGEENVAAQVVAEACDETLVEQQARSERPRKRGSSRRARHAWARGRVEHVGAEPRDDRDGARRRSCAATRSALRCTARRCGSAWRGSRARCGGRPRRVARPS